MNVISFCNWRDFFAKYERGTRAEEVDFKLNRCIVNIYYYIDISNMEFPRTNSIDLVKIYSKLCLYYLIYLGIQNNNMLSSLKNSAHETLKAIYHLEKSCS